MAGIIGQITANARKRKDAKNINSDKCMYHIPQFDTNGFNPMLHNSYVRNRARIQTENIINVEENIEEEKVSKLIIFVNEIFNQIR